MTLITAYIIAGLISVGWSAMDSAKGSRRRLDLWDYVVIFAVAPISLVALAGEAIGRAQRGGVS